VSPDSGSMVVVAESDSDPGQRLEARVDYTRPGTPDSQTLVTPATVRRAIELALEEGWEPASRGKPPFKLKEGNRILDDAPNTSLERTRER
jgi:hypothetical protein